jgi:signal transduction histidine kinase
MTIRSLRLRLLVLATGVIILVMVLAGLGLSSLFYRHIERRIGQELDTHIDQITAALRFSPDGEISLFRQPADPRFQQVYGGLYWQVTDQKTGKVLRSRSLWDTELDLPGDKLTPGQIHVHGGTGPRGNPLLVHEQVAIIPFNGSDHDLRVAVAIDKREITELNALFGRDVTTALVILGGVLLAGFAIQIGAGLRPMRAIRDGLNDIRSGKAKRLSANVPEEIAPLVTEVNELLESQEKEMIRARDRAADLAHGLKSPLTALSADIRNLRRLGQNEIADDLDELAQHMRRHMERELSRARTRYRRTAMATQLAPAIEAIIRTLKKTPDGSSLSITADIDADLIGMIDRESLNEIIGNLGENATRHARSKVAFRGRKSDAQIVLSIEDDGPGVDENMRNQISTRGKRLDETGKGTGLGLAIVNEILDEIGGSLELEHSELGGLCAEVRIPAAKT